MAEQKIPLLEMWGITKYFGKVCANNNINIKLFSGEVLALLGENGAGKSTLMNIIYGIYHPDEGKLFVRGEAVKIANSKAAMACGIGMVHQHFMLIGRFSAVENIVLISRKNALSRIDRKKVRESLEEIKLQYGIEVDLDCPVEQLSISGQQKVEILKLLYTGADILILDEPTAVLLPHESEALFSIIRNMTGQGKGVIFISHKLDEVLEISDRINVLSHGTITGEISTANADKATIIHMTQSGKVGYVGGGNNTTQQSDKNAFIEGVASVSTDIEVKTVITGTFDDSALGKETAIAMIEEGVDVILQTCDHTGLGVLEACSEKNVYCLGYTSDQSGLVSGDLCLTSMLIDIPYMISSQIDLIKAGNYGGQSFPGLHDGVVSMSAFSAAVPADVAEQVNAVVASIASGETVITPNYSEG